jgi:2-polyprenyl-3-methyl-5-hydroxy-6-metoxy-1,4-benzoquinol methylase
VLDLGCGNGALSYDIAKKVAKVEVLGIDLNSKNIAVAHEKYSHQNINYVVGDVLADGNFPINHFDVVILSNVLEHLPDRLIFLSKMWDKVNSKRMLIRAPLFERDWRVPLKKELGVEWRLDLSYETEYTIESWAQEIEKVGLTVTRQEVRWSEIWEDVIKVDS